MNIFPAAFACFRHLLRVRQGNGAQSGRRRLTREVCAWPGTIVRRVLIALLVRLEHIALLSVCRRLPCKFFLVWPDRIAQRVHRYSTRAACVLLATFVLRAPTASTARPANIAKPDLRPSIRMVTVPWAIIALPGKSAWHVSARFVRLERRRRIAYRARRATNALEAEWYRSSALLARMQP